MSLEQPQTVEGYQGEGDWDQQDENYDGGSNQVVAMGENGGYIMEDGLEYFLGEDGYYYAYEVAPEEGAAEATASGNGANTERPVAGGETTNTSAPQQQALAEQVKTNESLVAGSGGGGNNGGNQDITPGQDWRNTKKGESAVVGRDATSGVLHATATEANVSFGVFSDIILDVFFSKFFLVYLTIMLYCAAVLLIMLNIEYTFGALIRLFSPPSPKSNGTLEAFAFLAAFLLYSFIAVSSIGVLVDMMKQIWSQTRERRSFWGMKNTFIWETEPPCIIYFAVILATLVLPLFWGIIEAITAKQSVVYVAQRFANVAVLATVVLVVICYGHLYCRAIYFKKTAFDECLERDDFELREKAYKNEPEKMFKTHWYHASTILEEFGVDRDTLLFHSLVFILGLTPLLGIYTAQTMCTFIGDPSFVWGLVSAIGISVMVLLSWLSRLNAKGQWSAYSTFFLVLVLFVMGIVGAASSRTPGSAGVIAGLGVVSQGMLTRKRKHKLTRKEIQSLLSVADGDYTVLSVAPTEIWFDRYLCCCKNLVRDTIGTCFNIEEYFKEPHPKLLEAEKRYARKKLALRTDQKHLLVWWLFIMVLVAFSVGLGNAVQYNFSSPIAVAQNTSAGALTPASIGSDIDNPLCQLHFNENSSTPFTLLDMAFLGALSYTYGANGDSDFVTWFGNFYPQFYRVYPERLAPNRDYATDGLEIHFSHYVDFETEFHVITLNSNTRGLAWFRNIDDWGPVLALQGAEALSPLISIWPDPYKTSFVKVSGAYRKWFTPYDTLTNVTAYVSDLIETTDMNRILIVGDQFNGGYAKFLASSLGVRYLAFNPPGTGHTLSQYGVNGTQIVSSRSLWSYVDSLEDTSQTYLFPCNQTVSATKCSGIVNTISYLLNTCGDDLGRSTIF